MRNISELFNQQVFQKTIDDLGGNKFSSMVSAIFIKDTKTNSLKVHFKGSKVANVLIIKISRDLYQLDFYKLNTKGVLKFVKNEKDVFDEQLKDVFEEVTGLALQYKWN